MDKKISLRKKPYFCFDENLQFIQLRKKANKYARFIPVKRIVKVKNRSAYDSEIIKECDIKDIHIITHNTSDFNNPPSKTVIGIVCVGFQDDDIWLPKIMKLLKQFPNHTDYHYKTIMIGNEIIIRDRRTKAIKIV